MVLDVSNCECTLGGKSGGNPGQRAVRVLLRKDGGSSGLCPRSRRGVPARAAASQEVCREARPLRRLLTAFPGSSSSKILLASYYSHLKD